MMQYCPICGRLNHLIGTDTDNNGDDTILVLNHYECGWCGTVVAETETFIRKRVEWEITNEAHND